MVCFEALKQKGEVWEKKLPFNVPHLSKKPASTTFFVTSRGIKDGYTEGIFG